MPTGGGGRQVEYLAFSRDRLLTTIGTMLRAVADATFLVARDGRLIDANERGLGILGLTSARGTSEPFTDLVAKRHQLLASKGDGLPLTEIVDQALLGAETQDAVQVYRTPGGGETWASISCTPVRLEDGQVALAIVVCRDITKWRQAEQALTESEARFRRLAENAEDIIYRYDIEERRCSYISPAVTKILGYHPEEFYASPDLHLQLVHPDDRDLITGLMFEAKDPDPSVVRWVHRDGRPVLLEQRHVLIRDDGGREVAVEGIARDVTSRHERIALLLEQQKALDALEERERSERQARLLEEQRSRAILEEREHLARELHDTIGQVLGYVNVQALAARKLLARSTSPKGALDEILERVATAAQQALVDVREFIFGVKEVETPDHRLIPLLEHYLAWYSKYTGIETKLEANADADKEDIGATVQMHLLRIIQEALANVRKHAKAKRVRVAMSVRDHRVRVVIDDDGVGFDLSKVEQSSDARFGLRSMHERAAGIGGAVIISTALGEGTKVCVDVPSGTRGDS